jgi:hypothetical protein
MLPVTCYVADFNLRPGFPVVSDLSLKGRSINSYLKQASGTAAIDVAFDFSRRGRLPEAVNPLGVSTGQMMDGLARVLAPVPSSGKPVIGLLFADQCADARDQFGLMFDIDGDAGLGPRQGCAVFLTAIAAASGTDLNDQASKEFISFIALHELGHAFNLWHVDDDTVMQTHPSFGDLGSLTFEDTQEHFLSLAGDSHTATSVLPGLGCSEYGTRPDGFPRGDFQPFAGPARKKGKVALRIGLSTDSLWPFEPIELDVTLSVPKAAKRSISVPNEIDPGYSSFQIWVTRPDGVRFRYRPAARFCGRNGTLRIEPGVPYVRDIAIGRESGGYTFSVPGEYQVQVAFAVTGTEFIMSNVAKCEVKPPRPSSPDWLEAKQALDNVDARRFLQYKRLAPSLHTYA